MLKPLFNSHNFANFGFERLEQTLLFFSTWFLESMKRTTLTAPKLSTTDIDTIKDFFTHFIRDPC